MAKMTDTLGSLLTRLLAHGLLISQVAAHGYVQGIVADGVFYQGYRPSFQYSDEDLSLAGWSDPRNVDNGPVRDYTSPDIICHLDATPGQAYAEVQAGGTVELQWTPWPVGHLGPVISYLANCNGECTNVDKTSLLFNKVDAVGLVQGGSSPGTWAASELIANNNSWTLTIPSSIAPGNYVLRHEIIALQEAMVLGGAQKYPQCINLKVTGSGTNSLQSGTLGTQLYNTTDPGLYINIYQALNNYTIPGPLLVAGADNDTSLNLAVTTTVGFPDTTATSTTIQGYFNTTSVTTVANSTSNVLALPSTTTTTTSTAAVAAASIEVASSRDSTTTFSFATPTTFQTLISGRLPVPFTYVGAYGEVTVTVTPAQYPNVDTTSSPTQTANRLSISTSTTTSILTSTSTDTGEVIIAGAYVDYNSTLNRNVSNLSATITATAAAIETGIFNIINVSTIASGFQTVQRRRLNSRIRSQQW